MPFCNAHCSHRCVLEYRKAHLATTARDALDAHQLGRAFLADAELRNAISMLEQWHAYFSAWGCFALDPDEIGGVSDESRSGGEAGGP